MATVIDTQEVIVKKPQKFKPVRNEELASAMRELRKSSASAPHEDRRTRRARSRADAKRRALREQ